MHLAPELETRSTVYSILSTISVPYLLSHCFRLCSVKTRPRLARVIKMEFEESLTLSGQEKISQRRPEYSEDDIIRRFIGTFPHIRYLFGLPSAKVRYLKQQILL